MKIRNRLTSVLAITFAGVIVTNLTGCVSDKAIAASDSAVPVDTFAVEVNHYHPKGKSPSKHTIAVIEKARASMPFSDKRDFEEQKKGFIAAPTYNKIMADAGHVAWDMDRWQWIPLNVNQPVALL